MLKIVKKILLKNNELSSITYEAKQMFALWDWRFRRYTHALMTVSSIVVMNTRNWMLVPSAKPYGIRSGEMILVMSRGSLPRREFHRR